MLNQTMERRDKTVQSRPMEILLVEDCEGDAILVDEAFKEGKLLVHLNVVRDGVEAVKFLLKKEPYLDAPRPELVLLDINLPRKNGHEVLREIKEHESLKNIPVIVLTSSKVGGDIIQAYDSGATCFITKPFGFAVLEAVREIEHFWLGLVTLPPK